MFSGTPVGAAPEKFRCLSRSQLACGSCDFHSKGNGGYEGEVSFSIVRAVNVYQQPLRVEWDEDEARTISASMRNSQVSCPHRVAMDVVEDPAKRDPVNPFVELLWDRGSAVECERIVSLDQPSVDPQSENARASRICVNQRCQRLCRPWQSCCHPVW